MTERSLLLVGHTTEDIADVRHVHELAAALRDLLDATELSVHWEDAPNYEQSRTASMATLSDSELADIYAQGGIALSGGDGMQARAGIEWNRLKGADLQRFLNSRGHVQNQVTLQTTAQRLDNVEFARRYVDFAHRIATHFDVSLLYVYDPMESDARYFGRSGLGVGLRDVYWLTVFGAPYVNIIGRERLLDCPAAAIESLAPEMVSLRLTPDYSPMSQAAMRKASHQVREHIGERYFAKTHLENQPEPPGSGSLLNPFRLLRLGRFLSGAKRQFRDEAIRAETCPEFDWSNILLETKP